MTDDQKIEEIFSWFQREMLRVGRGISFPRCKDRRKTYLWRQLRSFSEAVNGFDDVLIRKILRIIVDYSYENQLLQKGASILCRSDIFQICQKKLAEELKQDDEFVKEVKMCEVFLLKHQGTQSRYDALMNKRDTNRSSNLTCWYGSGRITKTFLAISKSCCRAISKMDEKERCGLPNDIELIKLRERCLRSGYRREKLQDLMGEDLHQ